MLTIGVSTRILSWAIANEEFFHDILAPLLNLTNEDASLSETDAIVQGWILEIGRRRVAKLLKKASNLSFKEAFSNLSDSIDYIVLPESTKSGSQLPLSKAISQLLFVTDDDTYSTEIEADFDEHYIESAKLEPSNNSPNSIKAIASKARKVVSNINFHTGEKVSEGADNSEKPEKKSPPTDNTKQNPDISEEISNPNPDISEESSNPNPDILEESSNPNPDILPIGIYNSKPIKHYKNILALERLKATRICNTNRKLLSYPNLTEEREFKAWRASYNKSSSSNFPNDKY